MAFLFLVNNSWHIGYYFFLSSVKYSVSQKLFIDGLRPQTKQLLDASTGGKIKLKTLEEDTELIENMSANDHPILRDRTHQPTKKSLIELSSHDALLAQNKLLSKQLEILTETLGKLPTKLSMGQPTHFYFAGYRLYHLW